MEIYGDGYPFKLFDSAPMTGTVVSGTYTASGPVDSPLVYMTAADRACFHFSWSGSLGLGLPSGSIQIMGGLISGSLVKLPDVTLADVSGSTDATKGSPRVVVISDVAERVLSVRYTHATGSGLLNGWVYRKSS